MRGLVKWVMAPVIAVAVGYFLLGPKLAGDPKLRKLVLAGTERITPKLTPEEPKADSEAPQVHVDVKPVR